MYSDFCRAIVSGLLGTTTKTTYSEGIHFHIPFLEKAIVFNTKLEKIELSTEMDVSGRHLITSMAWGD